MDIARLIFTVIIVFVLNLSANQNRAKPKSVLIESLIENGNRNVATGTGFFVKYKNDFFFVTNWHILTGKEINGDIKNIKPDGLGLFLRRNNLIADTFIIAANNWGEYTDSLGLKFDIAAVKFPSPLTYDVSYFDLDKQNNISISENIYNVVGYSRSHINSNSNFYSPKLFKVEKVTFPFIKDYPIFQYGGGLKWADSLEAGLSGSPIFSSNGNLIGIYSLKIQSRQNRFQPFAFYWNVDAIKLLIDKGTPYNKEAIK